MLSQNAPAPKSDHTPARLNDLTSAEIAAYREKATSRREKRACLWCEKVIPMRSDQHFCSASCRSAYSAAAARIAYEKLCHEKDVWLAERAELLREISNLRSLLSSR